MKILQKSHYKLPNFFFTGDPAQIINPSGFSWNKVKDLIYNLYNNSTKSQSIQKDELKLNFRSTEGIVNLGRKILESNDVNTHELLFQEAYRKGGEMPLVITLSEINILRDNDDFGSRNAIIVANEQEKNKLKKQFRKDGIESERIFLFTEVKGLEFDEVLVWKFFEYFNSWGTNPQDLEKFKHNLLYVCTTRAREKLYFYEGENANAFWQSSRIEKCILITDQYEKILSFFDADETVGGKIASAKKYEQEGNYLFAKEIYGRCNYQNDVTRMDALICEEAKQFDEAAKYWEIAAVGYEKDTNWSDAENCWRKLSNWEKVALTCESQEKWLDAATVYEELSDFENTARCYTNLENWAQVERCWRNLSNWEKVAVACEKQEKWLDAAIEWKKVPDFEKAADNYCRANAHKDAVRCLLEVENWQRIEEIYRKSSTLSKFADLCESRKKWEPLEKVLTEIYTQKGWRSVSVSEGMRLASVQEKNGNLNKAIDSWLTYARNPERAVELLLKQKKWQMALQSAEEINNTQLREKYKNIANLGLQEEKKELESLVQSYQQNECEQIEDYTDHEIEEYKRNYLINESDSDETKTGDIKSNYQDPDDDDLDDDLEWEDNNYYYEPPSAFDHIDYGYIMDMSSDYESGLWR